MISSALARAEDHSLSTPYSIHSRLRWPGISEEVAAAVVFLASEQASFIKGANLRVDGRSLASL